MNTEDFRDPKRHGYQIWARLAALSPKSLDLVEMGRPGFGDVVTSMFTPVLARS